MSDSYSVVYSPEAMDDLREILCLFLSVSAYRGNAFFKFTETELGTEFEKTQSVNAVILLLGHDSIEMVKID